MLYNRVDEVCRANRDAGDVCGIEFGAAEHGVYGSVDAGAGIGGRAGFVEGEDAAVGFERTGGVENYAVGVGSGY